MASFASKEDLNVQKVCSVVRHHHRYFEDDDKNEWRERIMM